MEIGFMYAAKRLQERTQCCTRTFATVAMDFAHAIAIVIPRPLVLPMVDGRVLLLDPVVTTILVGVDDRFSAGTASARMPWQVALSLCPTTQQRSSPVSRLMI
jgi:hypothetical protein